MSCATRMGAASRTWFQLRRCSADLSPVLLNDGTASVLSAAAPRVFRSPVRSGPRERSGPLCMERARSPAPQRDTTAWITGCVRVISEADWTT